MRGYHIYFEKQQIICSIRTLMYFHNSVTAVSAKFEQEKPQL